jgi:hypothetical protein
MPLWKNSIVNAYKPYLKDTVQTPVGKKLIDYKTGGDYTVAPSVSPDGKYIHLPVSPKELFTIDLFPGRCAYGAASLPSSPARSIIRILMNLTL